MGCREDHFAPIRLRRTRHPLAQIVLPKKPLPAPPFELKQAVVRGAQNVPKIDARKDRCRSYTEDLAVNQDIGSRCAANFAIYRVLDPDLFSALLASRDFRGRVFIECCRAITNRKRFRCDLSDLRGIKGREHCGPYELLGRCQHLLNVREAPRAGFRDLRGKLGRLRNRRGRCVDSVIAEKPRADGTTEPGSFGRPADRLRLLELREKGLFLFLRDLRHVARGHIETLRP